MVEMRAALPLPLPLPSPPLPYYSLAPGYSSLFLSLLFFRLSFISSRFTYTSSSLLPFS